jgi:ElaB/YqjD/DUF883 family membrane-anchored ribosome-binding protein
LIQVKTLPAYNGQIASHIPNGIFFTRNNKEISMNPETKASTDKLVADMKTVISDAEELLHVTASQAGEKVSAARARAQENLRAAKERLRDAEQLAEDKARAAARAADEYVQDHPWQSVGVAAAIGIVIGMLIARR